MQVLPTPIEDGLYTPEVGPWSEDKYRIVSLYDTMFSTGMKGKWSKRVYIDLYAGAGQVRIEGTKKLFYGSPLLALQTKDPFDKYIFCEADPAKFAALEARTRRVAPLADVSLIPGDCDSSLPAILAAIPQHSKQQSVLNFCFVDPFGINIDFSTIQALASRFTDFLVLLAIYMDANRNWKNYVDDESAKVDKFLGDASWRTKWKVAEQEGRRFPAFLAESFAMRMQSLGYLPPPQRKTIRSDSKNLKLYDLVLFSKNQRAYAFWDEVLEYSTDQRGLF